MKYLSENEKKAILELKNELDKISGNKISALYLYGSKARGDTKRTSDIDVLVITRTEDPALKKHILNISFDIILKRSVDLSVIVLPLPRWNKYSKLPTSFSYQVQREAVKL